MVEIENQTGGNPIPLGVWGERNMPLRKGLWCVKRHWAVNEVLLLYRSVSIMIHRRRHKKGIPEFCWRGCPVKVHKTFTGHPLFCEKCRFQGNAWNSYILASIHSWLSFVINLQISALIFGQPTKLALRTKKWDLIGLEMSAFLFTLLIMEPMMGGECGWTCMNGNLQSWTCCAENAVRLQPIFLPR